MTIIIDQLMALKCTRVIQNHWFQSFYFRLKREELSEPDIECMKNMDNKSPFSTLSFTG